MTNLRKIEQKNRVEDQLNQFWFIQNLQIDTKFSIQKFTSKIFKIARKKYPR